MAISRHASGPAGVRHRRRCRRLRWSWLGCARKHLTGMTTAARQRRVLAEIERALRRTDPHLASKFGMFSRLTREEDMPCTEQTASHVAGWRSRMKQIGQPPHRLRAVLGVAVPADAGKE
jgi:hypothetical protein